MTDIAERLRRNGYADSLEQQARWIREALDQMTPESARIELQDVDTDELDGAAKELDRLTARIAELEKQAADRGQIIGAQQERIGELEAGLKPFAKNADFYKPEILGFEQVQIPLEFLRAARRLIPGDLPSMEDILAGKQSA